MKDDVLTLGKDRGARRWPGRLAAAVIAALAVGLLALSLVRHLPTQPSTHHAAHAAHPAKAERLDSPERPDGPVQLAGLGAKAARLLNARSPSAPVAGGR